MIKYSLSFIVFIAILLLFFKSNIFASSTNSFQRFLVRYSDVTKLDAAIARKTYTDQQLAKIGVIKDYSALTQARLYLTADTQLEAMDSYKKIILQIQAEGFDQTEVLKDIDELENKYIFVINRIDQLENQYKNLEYKEYGSIRPTYNNILRESVELATSLEQLNTEIYELIINNK